MGTDNSVIMGFCRNERGATRRADETWGRPDSQSVGLEVVGPQAGMGAVVQKLDQPAPDSGLQRLEDFDHELAGFGGVLAHLHPGRLQRLHLGSCRSLAT